jgi:periplasmic protein TonB
MSSVSHTPLASLDDSLVLLGESLGKIKAAKSFNTAEVSGQFNEAAESAQSVRELVWAELPDASWRSREELDVLIDQIQKIVAARAIQQQRSRLMALASALERGTIMHRRAQRASDLNQLRDQAVRELRSRAESEEAPPHLPGPQADQWMGWAWGLQEPEDAESVQALRNGFAQLDDFVASLEPNMWVAGPPARETVPEPEKSAGKQPERRRLEEIRFETPAVSAGANLATGVGFDPKDKAVPHVKAGSDGGALTAALASLDGASAVLSERFEKLKAAQTVDPAGVAEQLKMAAESGDMVRSSVEPELPEASWQNRGELDALVGKIQTILAAWILEQQRAGLLALATELERGRIVHRRAQRAHELNQLRELAINELRSQAGLEGGPQTLPGPQADQWIEWACSLREPEDAESLQALHNGHVHLDDFVANLERSMWIAGEPPTVGIPPKPKKSAGKPQLGQSRMEKDEFEEAAVSSGSKHIETEVLQFSGRPDEMPVIDARDELPPLGLESNTLTPNDVTPPRSEEDEKRIAAQEHSLMASLMGLIRGPAGQYNAAAERPFTAALFREPGAAPSQLSLDPHDRMESSVECPPPPGFSGDTSATPTHSVVHPVVEFPLERPVTTEALQKVNAAPARLVRGRAALFKSPVLRPIAARVFRETAAAPEPMVHDREQHSESPVLHPFSSNVWGEESAAPSLFSKIGAGFEETWDKRWPMLLAVAAVLALTALGALLWRSRANKATTTPVAASGAKTPVAGNEAKPAALPPDTPLGKEAGRSETSDNSETPVSTAKTSAKEQKKPHEQSPAPGPASKASTAKPASKREIAVLQTPMAVPGNIVIANRAEAAPKDTTEMPNPDPGGLPSTTSKGAFDIDKNTALAAPKTADQTVRISSGVTETLLIHTVAPRYPQEAMVDRVEGTVVLQALIGKDGSVQNLKVLNGHPVLNQAAIDAVRQWRYKPYQVNGEPVEAITQINVKFRLSGR